MSVDDGRVVLAAEALPDLGERGVRQLLAHVHRDLARHRDGLGVVSRLEFSQFQVVVVRDVLLNDLDCHGSFVVVDDVTQIRFGGFGGMNRFAPAVEAPCTIASTGMPAAESRASP